MSLLTTTIAMPVRRSLDDVCDNLSIVVLAVVALVAAATFRSYGLGWDDYTHAEYAELLIRLYASGFTDQAALSFANLYMYGGGFDVIAELMHRALGSDLFETRRLLGAIVGIAGLAVTWRVARRVGGPLAGLAAVVILALTPNYYGHMFMNPKDAPFRGRDDGRDARLHPPRRGISQAVACDRAAARHRAWPCDRIARAWRLRHGLSRLRTSAADRRRCARRAASRDAARVSRAWPTRSLRALSSATS